MSSKPFHGMAHGHRHNVMAKQAWTLIRTRASRNTDTVSLYCDHPHKSEQNIKYSPFIDVLWEHTKVRKMQPHLIYKVNPLAYNGRFTPYTNKVKCENGRTYVVKWVSEHFATFSHEKLRFHWSAAGWQLLFVSLVLLWHCVNCWSYAASKEIGMINQNECGSGCGLSEGTIISAWRTWGKIWKLVRVVSTWLRFKLGTFHM